MDQDAIMDLVEQLVATIFSKVRNHCPQSIYLLSRAPGLLLLKHTLTPALHLACGLTSMHIHLDDP